MNGFHLWLSSIFGWVAVQVGFHFIPKFTNSIQHLVKVTMYYLYGPPKGLVYNPKPLVVTNNMKEHCNLLLNCATFCFRYKAPMSKKVAQSKKKEL
jgi:hypothetical protein